MITQRNEERYPRPNDAAAPPPALSGTSVALRNPRPGPERKPGSGQRGEKRELRPMPEAGLHLLTLPPARNLVPTSGAGPPPSALPTLRLAHGTRPVANRGRIGRGSGAGVPFRTGVSRPAGQFNEAPGGPRSEA